MYRLLSLILVLAAACAPPVPTVPVATLIVSPYVEVAVESVQVRYAATEPVQVEMLIRGSLPDQCKYTLYSFESRTEKRVKITLYGIHTLDASCAQAKQSVQYTLLLGRDLPEAERGLAPGGYELVVNRFQTQFTIEEH